MRIIYSLLVLMLLQARLHAQVTISLPAPSPMGATLENALNAIITNAGNSSMNVYLVSSAFDAEKNLVAEWRTPRFFISAGTSFVSYRQLGLEEENYYDTYFSAHLASAGRFPAGEYIICTQLIMFEGNPLAEKCIQTKSMVMPLRLVYPYNHSVLKNRQPVFSWMPAAVAGKPAPGYDITYQLTVKEVLAGQSSYDAMMTNTEYLQIDQIPSTFYIYPATNAFGLVEDQKYAWQVKAFLGTHFIGESEIWDFSLKDDSLYTDTAEKLTYVSPKRMLDGTFYTAKGSLKFQFDGEYAAQSLSMVIFDKDMKDVSPKQKDFIQQIGDNRYEIRLEEYKDFRHAEFYTLVITNEKGERSYIRFRYKSPHGN